jgi:hypothetical protein
MDAKKRYGSVFQLKCNEHNIRLKPLASDEITRQ